MDKTKPHGEEFELPDSHHTNTLEGETQQSRIFTFIAFFFILNEKHSTLVLHGTFYRSMSCFAASAYHQESTLIHLLEVVS